eukprot:m.222794 g.222794  ORF g.222794 m.222794 type:complete len:345 (+) comp10825_c0_seq1:167-1201(+)
MHKLLSLALPHTSLTFFFSPLSRVLTTGTCNPGFNGSFVSALNGYFGKCTVLPCPFDGTGPNGCMCPLGYSGIVLPIAGGYTNSCAPVACPQDSYGFAPTCTCNVSFAGTITAIRGGFVGSCSYVPCPENTTFSGVACECIGNTRLHSWNGSAWVGSCTGPSFSPNYQPPLGPASLTQLIFNSYDDYYTAIGTLPFSFTFQGVNYASSLYVGSNSYITFGFASSSYYNLAANNPGRGLLVDASDNSFQRVYAGAENGGNTFRVRYEGTASTGGTVGSPNMVVEYTFFPYNIIMVSIGSMARNGLNGLSDGSNWLIQPPFTAYTSWVIQSVDGGTTWTYQQGSIV